MMTPSQGREHSGEGGAKEDTNVETDAIKDETWKLEKRS